MPATLLNEYGMVWLLMVWYKHPVGGIYQSITANAMQQMWRSAANADSITLTADGGG